MTYGAAQYKKTQVGTASQTQILIMLYEAAVKHVRAAIRSVEDGNAEKKGTSIGKAHDIVNELSNTLDFEAGGDIAVELDRLYNFIIDQLVKANAENSVDALKSVDNILTNLLEGWRGAVEQLSKKEEKA